MTEGDRNLRVAVALCKDFEGDFVALFDGQVVAVSDDPDDAISAFPRVRRLGRRTRLLDPV